MHNVLRPVVLHLAAKAQNKSVDIGAGSSLSLDVGVQPRDSDYLNASAVRAVEAVQMETGGWALKPTVDVAGRGTV